MFKIHIPQKNLILDAKQNENLMDVLMQAGLPVASSCLGEGICSKCAVELNPQSQASGLEIKTLEKNKQSLNLRLCCQVFIDSDLTVRATYW